MPPFCCSHHTDPPNILFHLDISKRAATARGGAKPIERGKTRDREEAARALSTAVARSTSEGIEVQA